MAAAEPGTGVVVKDCGLAVVVGSVVVGSAVGSVVGSVVDGSGVETDAVVDFSGSTFGERVTSAVPTTAAPFIAVKHPVSAASITSATAVAAGPRFRIMFVRYFDG